MMQHRKINDELLLQLVTEGKQQKQIAKHFKVSPAAICKRLKRLSSSPNVLLDKYDLTDKEKAFCIEKAGGRTNTQAALASYEVNSIESAKAIGSQLMAKAEVKSAIEMLMDECGLTQRHRISRLKQHVDNRDPNVSLKGLDLSWKLDGSYAPEKHVIQHDINAILAAGKNIDEELAQAKEELKKLTGGKGSIIDAEVVEP